MYEKKNDENFKFLTSKSMCSQNCCEVGKKTLYFYIMFRYVENVWKTQFNN